MSIGAKLVAVMESCRYMPQDGFNSFQKYKYTTAAGMFARINEVMTEQGLFTQVESTLVDLRDVTTSKGNAEKHAVVKVKITVTDSETGESVIFEGLGSGQDAGDKAVMKGNTAALKYAYIGGLCIAMSDDPEYLIKFRFQIALSSRHSSPRRQLVASSQSATLERPSLCSLRQFRPLTFPTYTICLTLPDTIFDAPI